MPTEFPPSSPILGAAVPNDDLYYQPSSDDAYGPSRAQFLGKRRLEQLYDGNGQYPTPVASSTTGRSSSPIREAANTPKNYHRRSVKTLAIELNPRDCSRLAIGRKKSVCDIVLPSKKNISRQHAFITYLPSEKQVKLECNGVNGIVVAVPRQLQCHLEKVGEGESAYRLMFGDLASQGVAHDKVMENYDEVTSFVLLKGESVLMPYIDGTVIDFRQAEGILTMKDVSDDESISTDTEDEQFTLMPQTNDFHEVVSTPRKLITIPHSPPTAHAQEDHFEDHKEEPYEEEAPQLAQNTQQTTPFSSFTFETPSTPRKVKKSWQIKEEPEESPLPTLRHNVPLLPSQKMHIPDLSKEHEQTKKKHKTSDKTVKTSEETLSSLAQRGLDCSELQHVLANHLAFANIQQTPLYQLQQVNSKINTLSRAELRALLKAESCIGVIYREGKDAAGKPLDEEYYYDVENDPDTERRNLVTALKGGRSGLRSCRRTHKQYFWKKPAK